MKDSSNSNDKEDRFVDGDTTVNATISRHDILSAIDSFVEQITKIRRTLLGVSISALILAPIAIGLSFYLLRHPSFFVILEVEDEFGTLLGVLLAAIIVISSIWLIAGIRQYRSVGSWSKRYREYQRHKVEVDRKILSKFNLDSYDDNNDMI